jgi:hypothetical protein
MAQCREIQRLPLNFTKFMDGRELREAVLREQSGGGIPYEVEVWYDDDGEQYFRGGWSQFAEDHDIHQGFFMAFDFHIGTSKFDVKIYDGTLCQKEYEARSPLPLGLVFFNVTSFDHVLATMFICNEYSHLVSMFLLVPRKQLIVLRYTFPSIGFFANQ